jgi:hypothetical protein
MPLIRSFDVVMEPANGVSAWSRRPFSMLVVTG